MKAEVNNGFGAPQIKKPCTAALAKSSVQGNAVCVDGTADGGENAMVEAWAQIYPANPAPQIPRLPPSSATSLDGTDTGFHKDQLLLPSGTAFIIVVWVLWEVEGGSSTSGGKYIVQSTSKSFSISSVGSTTDCSPPRSCSNGFEEPKGQEEEDSLEQKVHWLCEALRDKEIELQKLKAQLNKG
jgi:hypothetical protein